MGQQKLDGNRVSQLRRLAGGLLVGAMVLNPSAHAQLKVGGGVVSPSANVQVQADSGKQFFIDKATGNVGIGTATPANRLEVNSGTSGQSGVRLKQLPNAAVLSTNANGDVVANAAAKSCACGDIKTSLQASNHGEWQLANAGGTFNCPSGGAVTLPDLTATYLAAGVAAVGNIAGVNSKTIAMNNLPSYSPPITLSSNSAGRPEGIVTVGATQSSTQTAGAHTHTNNSSSANGGYGLVRIANSGEPRTTPGALDTSPGEPDLVARPLQFIVDNSVSHSHTTTAHDHTASFTFDQLTPHPHTASAESLSGGLAQVALDATPKSLVVNYFTCVN